MFKLRTLWLLALSLVLLCIACSGPTAKRGSTPAMSTATPGPQATPPSGLTFRLHQSQGLTQTVIQPPFEVRLANCQGPFSLVRTYTQALAAPAPYTLDLAGAVLNLDPYRPVMEAVLREHYGDAASMPSPERAALLEVAPGTEGRFVLRWEERWEDNSLDVLRGDEIIASVPFRALTSAHLQLVSSSALSCAEAAALATTGTLTVGVPVVSAGGTPEAQSTAVVEEANLTPEPGWEPGSDDALALVRAYLSHLAQGQTEQAYQLLHRSYQKRLSYEAYVKAYSFIGGIELHSLEALRVGDGQESVRVGMTIFSGEGDRAIHTDWWTTFEVLADPDAPAYGRSIASTIMRPARDNRQGLQ